MNADDYIFFEDEPSRRKTRIVSVKNRRTGDELGKIAWWGAWRQYCFFPWATALFNPTCMTRITEEMLAMQAAWKNQTDV